MLSALSLTLVALALNAIRMTTDDLISTILTWLLLGQAPVHSNRYIDHSFYQIAKCNRSKRCSPEAKPLSVDVISLAPRENTRSSEARSQSISSTLWSSAGTIPTTLSSGPAELKGNTEPWTKLLFREENGTLRITNPTDDQVRISPFLELLPTRRVVVLAKPYLDAGESLQLPNSTAGALTKSVLLQPETNSGIPHAQYIMPVKHAKTPD